MTGWPRSPRSRAARSGPMPGAGSFRNKAAVVSMVLLAVIVLMAVLRSAPEPASIRRGVLGPDRQPAGFRQRALVRHRRQRPRPLRPHALRRPGLAGGRRRRHAGQPRHRRRLRGHGRLPRRQGRRGDDARRRHPLLAAVHVLRDHPGGGLRPPHRADLRGPGCGRVADHGPDRARPDALDPARASSSRRRGRRASPAAR